MAGQLQLSVPDMTGKGEPAPQTLLGITRLLGGTLGCW